MTSLLTEKAAYIVDKKYSYQIMFVLSVRFYVAVTSQEYAY